MVDTAQIPAVGAIPRPINAGSGDREQTQEDVDSEIDARGASR
jgi:hypothetical protein